jgi:hypothetical protein
MSKNINVNPDHYKTKGRDPQGQEVVHDLQRERFTREKANLEKKSSASPPSPPIPGTVGKKRVSLKKKAEKKKAN